jgi:hypothetical protein
MSNWPAPCALCGYNGPGFFQPTTHPCAKHATERDALLAEVARLREDLDVVDDDRSLAAKRWEAEAMRAHNHLRTVAERQRELCKAEAYFYAGLGWDAEKVAEKVGSVRLATEESAQ